MHVLVKIVFSFANEEGTMEITPYSESWSGVLKFLKQLDVNHNSPVRTFSDGSKVELVSREVVDKIDDGENDDDDEV